MIPSLLVFPWSGGLKSGSEREEADDVAAEHWAVDGEDNEDDKAIEVDG